MRQRNSPWTRHLGRTWRRVTAPLRALPDFVIVGAQKAGTTSLYAYLTAEPAVLPARLKEVHFFDTEKWDNGVLRYRSEFPLRAQMWLYARLRRHPVITGEATPYYLYHPLCARRIAQVTPQAKIIILLRNPVERTLSHYWHEVRNGREEAGLAEALNLEGSRLAGREEALADGQSPSQHLEHRNHSYVDRSRYARQVARYLESFPRDHVLILRSEDLFENGDEVKDRLSTFLGIPPLTRPFVAENVGTRPARNGGEYDIRRSLAAELADEEVALRQLLGREIGWSSASPGKEFTT